MAVQGGECQGIRPDGEWIRVERCGDGDRLLVMVAGLTRSTPDGVGGFTAPARL